MQGQLALSDYSVTQLHSRSSSTPHHITKIWHTLLLICNTN